MPALKKHIWELFARARAQGNNRTRAAEMAGYSVKRSSSQGSVLDKRAEVIARVQELNAVKAEVIESRERRVFEVAGINKEYILLGIIDGIELAREQKRASDMFKGYELLGKWLNLWNPEESEIQWDGDLSKLSDDQLHNLAKSLEKIADPAVVARAKRTLALESGEIIDVESTPAEPTTLAAPEGDQW